MLVMPNRLVNRSLRPFPTGSPYRRPSHRMVEDRNPACPQKSGRRHVALTNLILNAYMHSYYAIDSDAMTKIISALEKIRREERLKQGEMAISLGISQGHFSKVMSG